MSLSNWFESWFDTEYYHILYKDRDNKEAEIFIDNLVNFMKLPQNSSVLDLACGKGRHSITLFTHGYKVLGADLSHQSIDFASYFSNENLQFIVHDMREVIPNQKFDAVFNLFTSFGYFDSMEDNLKVLQSIHQMLNDDGWLIIDFMNAKKVINNLVVNEIKEIDGYQFNISRHFDGVHIYKNIDFVAENEQKKFTERVQALMLSDFQKILNDTHFEIICTFGDFNLGDFDENSSDRLILIARKR